MTHQVVPKLSIQGLCNTAIPALNLEFGTIGCVTLQIVSTECSGFKSAFRKDAQIQSIEHAANEDECRTFCQNNPASVNLSTKFCAETMNLSIPLFVFSGM